MKKRKVSLEKKRNLRSLKQNWTLLLLLLPACVMILVFNYVPMYGIQIAFRNFNFVDGITGSEWAGLKWFRYLFNSVQCSVFTRYSKHLGAELLQYPHISYPDCVCVNSS